MEKMEFIYTSGWEKFEQYCKELYRGYLNRYCQGNFETIMGSGVYWKFGKKI